MQDYGERPGGRPVAPVYRQGSTPGTRPVDPIVRRLTSMFSKIIAGTVTREEGAILINHLVKENREGTLNALAYLIENPPRNVFQKTVLHTIALARNRALFQIMAQSIHSRNEDVSLMAASELARLRTESARHALLENLDHETFHVRRNAAIALARDYGDEGVEILKRHILNHEEPFYRATSAQGLAAAGERGIGALFSILSAGEPGPVLSAAEALSSLEGGLEETYLPTAVEALMRAGDRREIPLVIELLKVVALFGARAMRYEAFIEAFAGDPSEAVRLEAQKTLHRIRKTRPGGRRG